MTKSDIHFLLLIPAFLCVVTGLAILFACLAAGFSGSPNQPDYQAEPLGWRKWRSNLDSLISRVSRYRRQRRQWRNDSMDEFSGSPINIQLLLAGVAMLAFGVALVWLSFAA